MSYLVLARKWRPQNFDDVTGQEHITQTLKRGIQAGRIAHAYILTGPRGVGKTTTARIFAKALNCLSFSEPTATPCNRCTNCIEITEGRSPDVMEIDGASHRGIDDARELQTHIQYATVGRYKVIIIDEVHMLTREAFNSLLKTLEEPPSNVVFIFATTEPDSVPLTILSRCQRFDFRLIGARKITEQIRNIAKAEGFTISEESAEFIALRADGSMRDALSLLDQVFAAEPEDEITIELVTKLLGIVPVQSFQQITEASANHQPKIALDVLSALLEGGIDPLQVAKGLVEHFRNALIAKSGALPDDYPNRKFYEETAQKRELRDLLRTVKLLSDTYNRMRRSDTPRYLLEEALVYLSLMDSVVDINELLAGDASSGELPLKTSRISKQEAEPDGLGLKPQEAIIEPHHIEIPPVEKLVDESELPKEPNERFLKILFQQRKSLATLLKKNTRIAFDDGRVLIKFPEMMETMREEILINPETIKSLEDAAKSAFGSDVSVELIRDLPPGKLPKSDDSDIPPKVRDVLTLFDAKLEN